MEKVMKIWFLASLCILCAYAGWYTGRLESYWMTVLGGIGILILVLLCQTWKRAPHVRWYKKAIPSAKYGLFLAVLLLGAFVARTNLLRVNDWMDGSMVYLNNMFHAVTFSADASSDIYLEEERRKELQENFSQLKIYDHGIDEKILVSFVAGLAVLDDKEITFLYGTGVMLSSVQQPDHTIIFVSRNGRRNVPRGPTSDLQILTKAKIQNNELQVTWERSIPGMYLHHWGDMFDGYIYHAGRDFDDLPNDLSERIGYQYSRCTTRNAQQDTIRIFDYDTGEYERSIDILPLIADLGDEEMLKNFVECQDPTHLNDFEVIKNAEHASFFPNGKVGDILVSIRNLNTVALLDRDTSEIKWHVTDKFKRQHSPIITDWGTIIIFDNEGSDARNGRSRIVEIDIASRELVGVYEASGDDFMESRSRGKVKLFGNRLIVDVESPSPHHDAMMFILDCPSYPISDACKKTMIFSGTSPMCDFENAVILRESS
jgi:hypothetical protein